MCGCGISFSICNLGSGYNFFPADGEAEVQRKN